jgi:hypothetical protein
MIAPLHFTNRDRMQIRLELVNSVVNIFDCLNNKILLVVQFFHLLVSLLLLFFSFLQVTNLVLCMFQKGPKYPFLKYLKGVYYSHRK